jgi:hypothetical protein
VVDTSPEVGPDEGSTPSRTLTHKSDASEDATEGNRLEYSLLREQIAEADRTCVGLLGVLITGTLALVSFSIERAAPGIAWLVGPLWVVGFCYLAEKRSIIVHTARYIRTELESNHPGLRWETWHHHQVDRSDAPKPVRFYPFYLEMVIAGTAVFGDVLLVRYLSRGGPMDAPWFPISLVVAAVFLVILLRTGLKYSAFERYLAQLR